MGNPITAAIQANRAARCGSARKVILYCSPARAFFRVWVSPENEVCLGDSGSIHQRGEDWYFGSEGVDDCLPVCGRFESRGAVLRGPTAPAANADRVYQSETGLMRALGQHIDIPALMSDQLAIIRAIEAGALDNIGN